MNILKNFDIIAQFQINIDIDSQKKLSISISKKKKKKKKKDIESIFTSTYTQNIYASNATKIRCYEL